MYCSSLKLQEPFMTNTSISSKIWGKELIPVKFRRLRVDENESMSALPTILPKAFLIAASETKDCNKFYENVIIAYFLSKGGGTCTVLVYFYSTVWRLR